MANNALYYGDNLEIMRALLKKRGAFIDLVYIDPPFNSKRNYNILFKQRKQNETAQVDAFKDTWSNELPTESLSAIEELGLRDVVAYLDFIKKTRPNAHLSYLSMMAIRIYYIHELLKPTGSFYLHCDPTMSHYLKIVCDLIFGEGNFRNEIVWQRHTSLAKGSQHAPKSWGTTTDTILYYAKPKAPINPYRPLTDKERMEQFPLKDENGERYYDDSSHIWSTPNMGARPNLCYEWRGYKNPHKSGWRLSKKRMEEEYQRGNIVIKPDGKLERRKYERDYRGKQVGNFWSDIPPALGSERMGYDTQKPLALLRRIIAASSKKGDIVADFFCGCGTTTDAAIELKRKYIGADIALLGIALVQRRIEDRHRHKQKKHYDLHGLPNNFEHAQKLAKDDPFEFQDWAVASLAGGVPNKKKTGDRGIDGWFYFRPRATRATDERYECIIEVKGGANLSVTQVSAFIKTVKEDSKRFGLLLTMGHITVGMRNACSELGKLHDFPRCEVVSIKELMDGKIPDIIRFNKTFAIAAPKNQPSMEESETD